MFRHNIAYGLLVLAFGFWTQAAIGQSEKWETALISHHAVATLNLNVPRLCETYEGSEVLGKLEEYLLRRQVKLDQVDQFQSIFCRDPKLELGPDDITHMQVTFLEVQDFDLKTVGKMSGYGLTETKIGKWKALLGNPKNRGAWGGIPATDRTLVCGVTRMLNSVVESQGKEMSAAHLLGSLRKQDVDFCITISGGEPIAEVFAATFGTDQYSPAFELLDRGLIYFVAQSDLPLVVELHAVSEEAAKQLEIEIQNLIKLGRRSIEYFGPMIDKELEARKEQDLGGLQTELQSMRDSLDEASTTLDSLEIKVEETKIRVTSRENQILKSLIERAVKLATDL